MARKDQLKIEKLTKDLRIANRRYDASIAMLQQTLRALGPAVAMKLRAEWAKNQKTPEYLPLLKELGSNARRDAMIGALREKLALALPIVAAANPTLAGEMHGLIDVTSADEAAEDDAPAPVVPKILPEGATCGGCGVPIRSLPCQACGCADKVTLRGPKAKAHIEVIAQQAGQLATDVKAGALSLDEIAAKYNIPAAAVETMREELKRAEAKDAPHGLAPDGTPWATKPSPEGCQLIAEHSPADGRAYQCALHADHVGDCSSIPF